MPFFTKGNVRIRYEEVGSGFPLLVTPGGGLNSVINEWPSQVFNAIEEFKNEFRCITMDQRNANGGESSGPVQVKDPWGAFGRRPAGIDGPPRHTGVPLHGLLHRWSFWTQAHRAGAQAGLGRRALPAGRACARKHLTQCTTRVATYGAPSCAPGGLT